MPHESSAGDVLADRYHLVDLLLESKGGRFWRAHDQVLGRHVAIHVIAGDDQRAPALMEAAQRSSTVLDPRILRVLDADHTDELCYVVNEWGWGTSLDILVAAKGPMGPRRSAWLVSEVAGSLATAHGVGVAHGRLNPENVMVDRAGGVRVIGLCVDAALHGVTDSRPADDLTDVAGLLYCLLTTKWAGVSTSAVASAPREHGAVLRPRRVRAGVPRTLDLLCDELLHPQAARHRSVVGDLTNAGGISEALAEFVGDPTGMPAALIEGSPPVRTDEELVVLPPVPDIGLRLTDDSASQPAAEEVPTEAGVPIFDDDEIDVSWLARPGTAAPPPPPFDEHPERPLFAPEPDDGAPLRTPREGRADTGTGARPHDEFWPFGSETGAGSHAGVVGAAHTDSGLQVVDDTVPGRASLRVAVVLIAIVLVALGIVVAISLGSDGENPADQPTNLPTTNQSSVRIAPAPDADAGRSDVA